MLKLRGTPRSAKWARRGLVAVLVVGGPVALGVVATAAAPASCSTGVVLTIQGCTITGTATVGAGTLSVAAPATVKWGATLNGFDLNRDGKLTYTLVDATGSGDGWALTASATQFTNSTGTTRCTSTKPCTLPASALSVNGSSTTSKSTTGPSPTCATGSTCTLPTYSAVTYPVPITGKCATGVCTPATLATAAPSSGMGAVDCATDWWLHIPANAAAGTYSDTITLTLSTGP
jgi:hypothetical protein